MKNMKKLLRKAMVFTLTAAMLVGTPLTASAASLVDLYQIEDGWGTVTGNEDNSSTGTVTATGTYTTTLKDDQNEPVGIYLDNSNVELEYPEEGTLTAAIDWGTADGSVPENCKELNDEMLKHLDWEVKTTDVVALDGKFYGGTRETIKLHPKAPGTATVTVSLSGTFKFSASATVTVIRYADKLTFKETELKEEACVGNTINLNDYVNRYVIDDGVEKIANTSDVLTFSIKADPAKAAALKNGVLSLKKEGKVKVLAIGQKKGEKVGTGWFELTVEKGTNVKKITFKDGNKQEFLVNNGMTKDVTALIEKDDNGDCKNRITWTSKKPGIVVIEGASTNLKLDKSSSDTPESTVTLKAVAPGKAQIEAKASNGKKATLTVTVSANLSSIKIEGAPTKMYSGQSIDLYDYATQKFETKGEDRFTDAGLKWSFDGDKAAQNAMKKVASINANGVLTIKNDVSFEGALKEIKVKVANKKAVKAYNKKPGEIDDVLTIKLEQVNVTKITVKKGKTAIASAELNNKGKVVQTVKGKLNADTIGVNTSRTYTLVAEGTIGDDPKTVTLDSAVLGWSASGNGKIVKASKNDAGNGVIKAVKKGKSTITINSSAKKETKKGTTYVAIKTTFKETVNVPTKTLTLSVKNKTGIAAKSAQQTITIVPAMDKGTSTKKTEIIWSAKKLDKDGNVVKTYAASDMKNGKLKDTFDEAATKLVVNARVQGGPSAVLTLPVVTSGKVTFDKKSVNLKMTDQEAIELNDTVTVKVGGSTPGVNGVSPVTYTVNKPGIVRIRDKGNGELEINAVATGKVKITATTLDGQKKTLSVNVQNVSYGANFWAPKQ